MNNNNKGQTAQTEKRLKQNLALMVMCYIQIAQDQWVHVCNDKALEGRANYEKAEVRESFKSVFAGIKRKFMSKSKNGDNLFNKMREDVSEIVDTLDDELDESTCNLRGRLTQNMPYNFQLLYVHGCHATMFTLLAVETLKQLTGRNSNNTIGHILEIMDHMPSKYGVEYWKPIDPSVIDGIYDQIIEKVKYYCTTYLD